MTVNAGVIVSVPGNELLQFGCRLGEVFNVEGHILNQTGCSPTEGKMPERIAQYLEYSSGRSVKWTGM